MEGFLNLQQFSKEFGSNAITITPKKKGIKARSVLWYLTFCGFAINYMTRINLNIAIVDMIQSRQSTNESNAQLNSECFNFTSHLIETNNISLKTIKLENRFSFERIILKYFKVHNKKHKTMIRQNNFKYYIFSDQL